MTWELMHSDMLDALCGMPDNHFDAIACDPPYGFEFMGKRWDYSVPSVEQWKECLRVLKPGAPLVAFGGSRMYHRLAVNVEDAGFELRDQLMWLYAKGFPKSQNIGLAIDKAAGAVRPITGTRVLTGNAAVSLKDKGGTFGVQVGTVPAKTVNTTGPATELAQSWDGYGTALKPAHEPIVLARKPLDGTMVQNVARWGVGGLAIDACRIGGESTKRISNAGTNGDGYGMGKHFHVNGSDAGRWPANLLLSHGDDCVQLDDVWHCGEDCAVRILDEEIGPRKSGVVVRVNGGGGQIMSGLGDNAYKPKPSLPNLGYMDGKTNPSRFFFCAKVSTKEREAGCEALPLRSAGEVTDSNEDDDQLDCPRTGAGRTGGARNHQPTLKPISLTTWLARLIKPPRPGTLLVPFAGAGSEMIGAILAGWSHVTGIEQDAEYCEIARARIAYWTSLPDHTQGALFP
jgi:hypothetical protein